MGERRILWCKVLRRSGHALQLIKSLKPADHFPLAARIKIRLCFEPPQVREIWDRDLLANGLLKGCKEVADFKNKVFDFLGSTRAEHRGQIQYSQSTTQWDHLLSGIFEAGYDVFQKRKEAAFSLDSDKRIELLDKRRTTRLRIAWLAPLALRSSTKIVLLAWLMTISLAKCEKT